MKNGVNHDLSRFSAFIAIVGVVTDRDDDTFVMVR
jgi:hypothetical protein